MDWQLTHMTTDMTHDCTAPAKARVVAHPAVKTVTAPPKKRSQVKSCGLAHVSKLRLVLVLAAELNVGHL